MTYPPEPVNGFLVSGPDTPGVQAQFTYPPELKNELLADPRRYEIHGDYWGRTTPADYLRRLIETVQNHTRAWLYLLGKYQPDLFVGVFGSTDRAQHFLWKYSDPDHPAHEALEATSTAHPIRAVYQAVDAAISELLAAVGDDVTVIVMSDHGAGPCSKVVYLDRWLESQGLLTYRNDRGHSRRSLMQSAYLLARKHFPRWAKDWLKTRWHGVREGIESSILRDPIDWGRTQAFFLGTESAYIYLNLQGRFPEGVVRPGAEAESVSRRIVEGLSALQDLETGLPVVAAVHRKEEIYRGPRELVSLLPDLVVTWRDWSYVVRRARGEGAATPGAIVESGVRTGDAARFMSLELSGCHRPEGILLARGPGVPAGREVSGAHIMDLAPTMLSLLGVPIPAHMDGKVLPEVTGAGSPGRQSADAQADANLTDRHEAVSYSEEEREEMKRRLRALGYLE
jgi:predicted AlkP superfamily phosphohydrolase/phosphomutase